jgi:hypothetical protein
MSAVTHRQVRHGIPREATPLILHQTAEFATLCQAITVCLTTARRRWRPHPHDSRSSGQGALLVLALTGCVVEDDNRAPAIPPVSPEFRQCAEAGDACV